MSGPVASGARLNLDTLAGDWRLFRRHHPAGAYLPVGQLDGDCRDCGEAWPCTTIRDSLNRALVTP